MEIKIYSDKAALQSCYAKTIKRMEYHLNKDGKAKVTERLNKNYYWLQYEKPYANDDYYNFIRTQITNEEAKAAIQQAQFDFADYITNEMNEPVTEEDKIWAKKKYWLGFVSGVWGMIVNNGTDITKFNDYPLQYDGKTIKMGDIEAWGFSPSEKPRLVRICFLELWDKLYSYIKDPNPNKTRFYMDENGAIVRINEVYVSAEIMDKYTDNDFYEEEFGAPEELDFFDDPLALREDEM